METPTERPEGLTETLRGKAAGSRQTQFKKGQRRGKAATDGLISSPAESTQIPDLLGDYRHVYTMPESADRTAAQKLIRTEQREQSSTFLARLERLERVHAEEVAKKQAALLSGKGTETLPVGESEKRLLRRISDMLANFGG